MSTSEKAPGLVLVDYKAGNLTSVSLALSRVGVIHRISDDPEVVRRADRVVFPGVGAAGSAMATLRASGMAEALTESVGRGAPLLGICIGCQILLDRSEEDGGTECLGILPGTVRRFDFSSLPEGSRPKIPHMGWNPATWTEPHPLLAGLVPGTSFYFVHSFYPDPERAEDGLAVTEYGGRVFRSALCRGNVAATQFHAEKSGEPGLRILKNFSSWTP